MASRKKIVRAPDWQTVNWRNYRHERVLILWQVVALSMNAEPNVKNVAIAKKHPEFLEAYTQRVKSLTRMMSVIPDEGHVTYLPWHVVNENTPLARNRMVDVVSCINKLLKYHAEILPTEFIDLLKTLHQIQLPKEPPRNSGLVINSNVVISSSAATQNNLTNVKDQVDRLDRKKDQSKAVGTKINEQASAMLYAVVCDAYGYDASSTVSKNKTVKDIENALAQAGIKGIYGMSPEKIKEVLLIGQGHCPQKIQD